MRIIISLFLAAQLWGAGFLPLTFNLHDSLEHPFIWWPRTLLEYPVHLAGVDTRNLTLEDSEGHAVPFQLSSGNGKLSFFSDLPSGGIRVFTLKSGTPATVTPLVRESVEPGSIVLDSGKLQVRIPASQSNPVDAPGPVMQLARGAKWIGKSRFLAKVSRIETRRIESGPLFITYRITYDLSPKGRYSATIRVLGDTEFVELYEEMEGVNDARIETWWTGFQPTDRQAPNHPYNPGHEMVDPHEPIDGAQMNTHIAVLPGISPEGEMPFRLGLYQPWPAFSVGTFANFWNETTGDALGVFIDKVGRWNDHDYPIWNSSDRLQVHFYWRKGEFFWKWPLSDGTRSTCLSFYDHALDRAAVDDMRRMHAGVIGKDGFRYRSSQQPTSHMLFLQNRHGVMDLNEVKDWVLEYPDTAKHPPTVFHEGGARTPTELEQRIMTSDLMTEVVASGTRQNGGFGPVPSRRVGDWWVDGFNRLHDQLNERQRRRLTAALLLMAYTHAGEDYMPMRPMLSGHPNFLSDVKSVPALMSFLFPEHPMAHPWADEFRKYMELNTHYHTRPEVKAWESKGGRWTENLGTYVWGFVRPALRANYSLMQFDGGNRFPTPEMAQLGNYLVDALSSPFDGEPEEVVRTAHDMHQWGMVTTRNGPRRIHPPQGAHAERRMPPRSMWLLGQLLERFAPLTAEHLMWAARPSDQDFELPVAAPDPWKVMFAGPDNRGTDPHLQSAKYTGYGIILRAGVGTPDELSIHLQQIDEGPNYRWGNQPDSGTGAIYFYAHGKAYSHNGTEDTGDRATQDTDLQTNFGAWKDGKFRSIGRNDLVRPMYNLDVAQFAEVVPKSYSTPEYVSRSVMLVGKDYFATFDDVFNEAIPHRLSWFVGRYEELPFIRVVRGGGRNPEDGKTELLASKTKGVWYDGLGDTLAIVSHRHDLEVQPQKYGCRVRVDGGTDEVFRDNEGVDYVANGIAFRGTAGVVRRRADGTTQMALVHGTQIAGAGLSLSTEDRDLGIAATLRSPAEAVGIYHAPLSSRVRLEPAPAWIYIDGERRGVEQGEVDLTPGTHQWQITSGDPVPNAPRILRTENFSGGATLVVEPVPGASRYRVELSRDNGKNWEPAAARLSGLANGTKVHVRAIALNASKESSAGPEYPVYISTHPPLPPDGLSAKLRGGSVVLSWGEVLGVKEYRLYRTPCRRIQRAGSRSTPNPTNPSGVAP